VIKKKLNFKKLIAENEAKAAALEAGTASVNEVVEMELESEREAQQLEEMTASVLQSSPQLLR